MIYSMLPNEPLHQLCEQLRKACDKPSCLPVPEINGLIDAIIEVDPSSEFVLSGARLSFPYTPKELSKIAEIAQSIVANIPRINTYTPPMSTMFPQAGNFYQNASQLHEPSQPVQSFCPINPPNPFKAPQPKNQQRAREESKQNANAPNASANSKQSSSKQPADETLDLTNWLAISPDQRKLTIHLFTDWRDTAALKQLLTVETDKNLKALIQSAIGNPNPAQQSIRPMESYPTAPSQEQSFSDALKTNDENQIAHWIRNANLLFVPSLAGSFDKPENALFVMRALKNRDPNLPLELFFEGIKMKKFAALQLLIEKDVCKGFPVGDLNDFLSRSKEAPESFQKALKQLRNASAHTVVSNAIAGKEWETLEFSIQLGCLAYLTPEELGKFIEQLNEAKAPNDLIEAFEIATTQKI